MPSADIDQLTDSLKNVQTWDPEENYEDLIKGFQLTMTLDKMPNLPRDMWFKQTCARYTSYVFYIKLKETIKDWINTFLQMHHSDPHVTTFSLAIDNYILSRVSSAETMLELLDTCA